MTHSSHHSYYVDEAGDGVLFGKMGRDRLLDSDAPQFFMMGMIECRDAESLGQALEGYRKQILTNPLFSGIKSLSPDAKKTDLCFHANDDHAEIRSRVFEFLDSLDFRFSAVIKDMRVVRDYVQHRNQMDSEYRYHPNELYDLTVRILFKQRLHKEDHYRVVFARRGHADRTQALRAHLEKTRQRFLREHRIDHDPELLLEPAYPHEVPCLQIADYCLWALQRCYEKHEDRFLRVIWSKVAAIHDVDDPDGKRYGTYLTRKRPMPDPEQIKNRRI